MTTDEPPRAHLRAQRDLDEGRAWKARDRLTGYLQDHPHDQATLARLGEICHALGDLPAAGRYWAMTPRGDAEAATARAALDERCGGSPLQLLRQIDPRTPLEAYPPEVRERIGDLRRAVRKSGGWWEPKPPRTQGAPGGSDAAEGFRTRLGEALFTTLVILVFPVAWVVGVATMLVSLARWLF